LVPPNRGTSLLHREIPLSNPLKHGLQSDCDKQRPLYASSSEMSAYVKWAMVLQDQLQKLVRAALAASPDALIPASLAPLRSRAPRLCRSQTASHDQISKSLLKVQAENQQLRYELAQRDPSYFTPRTATPTENELEGLGAGPEVMGLPGVERDTALGSHSSVDASSPAVDDEDDQFLLDLLSTPELQPMSAGKVATPLEGRPHADWSCFSLDRPMTL
jgi:hypothetical protein